MVLLMFAVHITIGRGRIEHLFILEVSSAVDMVMLDQWFLLGSGSMKIQKLPKLDCNCCRASQEEIRIMINKIKLMLVLANARLPFLNWSIALVPRRMVLISRRPWARIAGTMGTTPSAQLRYWRRNGCWCRRFCYGLSLCKVYSIQLIVIPFDPIDLTFRTIVQDCR